jgi:hypothetical protein
MLNSTGIKILEVSVCSHQQLCELLTAMCGNNTIKELTMKRTPFYDSAGDYPDIFVDSDQLRELVSEMCIMNTGLRSLTLSINVSSDVIGVMCNALSRNHTLQKLTISTCILWPCDGVTNMLRLNKSLKELTILDSFVISDSKAFEELCSNRSLEKFCLRNGPKGIEIIQAFVLVMEQNTTLRELEVFAHDHQHIIILSDALKHNKTLAKMIIHTELNLDDAIVTEDKRLTIQTYFSF